MGEVGKILWCIFSPVKILLLSLKILLSNKIVFSSIIALTTLPLSCLIFALSSSVHNLRSQIYHLEAVAHLAQIRFEARHVLKESREDALSLLRIKALFSLPSYLLSLAASVSAVNSTLLAYHGKTPTLHSAAAAVKQNLKRSFVTTIIVYAILLAYAPVPRAVATIIASRRLKLLVMVIGSSVEVYLMAVLSMGLVVSIVEERFGWEAIKVASELIRGRRFCGWVLSGLFVLVSGLFSWKLKGLMDGQNSPSGFSLSVTAASNGVEEKVILIFAYGLAVLCSYVIMTVLYCDCRKRHPIREPEPGQELVSG